jgi:hypothetical protein
MFTGYDRCQCPSPRQWRDSSWLEDDGCPRTILDKLVFWFHRHQGYRIPESHSLGAHAKRPPVSTFESIGSLLLFQKNVRGVVDDWLVVAVVS